MNNKFIYLFSVFSTFLSLLSITYNIEHKNGFPDKLVDYLSAFIGFNFIIPYVSKFSIFICTTLDKMFNNEETIKGIIIEDKIIIDLFEAIFGAFIYFIIFIFILIIFRLITKRYSLKINFLLNKFFNIILKKYSKFIK